MTDYVDPRMPSVKPHISYNTIGGINGPLVVLDNVRGCQCRAFYHSINRQTINYSTWAVMKLTR